MYQFRNKTTGELKYGKLDLAGEGYDIFRMIAADGSELPAPEYIRVENPNMNAEPLTNADFDITLIA